MSRDVPAPKLAPAELARGCCKRSERRRGRVSRRGRSRPTAMYAADPKAAERRMAPARLRRVDKREATDPVEIEMPTIRVNGCDFRCELRGDGPADGVHPWRDPRHGLLGAPDGGVLARLPLPGLRPARPCRHRRPRPSATRWPTRPATCSSCSTTSAWSRSIIVALAFGTTIAANFAIDHPGTRARPGDRRLERDARRDAPTCTAGSSPACAPRRRSSRRPRSAGGAAARRGRRRPCSR